MQYRWWLVIISAVIFMMLIGSTISAFGLFVLPVSQEMDLSRASMNTAFILLSVGNAVWAPLVGWVVDRYSAARIIASSALLFGISFLILAYSRSIWPGAFTLLVLLPIAELGAGNLTLSVVLVRWFSENRGKALMIATAGMPLGSITVVPLISWLLQAYGWRATLVAAGVAVSVVVIALSSLVRDKPAESPLLSPAMDATPANDGPPPGRSSMRDILSLPQFWLISMSCAMPLAVGTGIAVSLAPFVIERGLTTNQATSLMSVTGGAALIGSLLISAIVDRFDRITLLAVLFVIGATMGALFLVSHDFVSMLLATVILGFSSGTMPPVFYSLLADRFGAASFGTVRGLSSPILAIAAAAAIRLSGEMFDRTGNYDGFFYVCIVAQLLGAGTIWLSRLMKEPAPATGFVA